MARWGDLYQGFSFVEGGKMMMNGTEVTISSFFMGKYEVTQDKWKSVTGRNPSRFNLDDVHGAEEAYEGEDGYKRPVESIMWIEAVMFCNRLSIKEGLTPCYSLNGITDPDKWYTKAYNDWPINDTFFPEEIVVEEAQEIERGDLSNIKQRIKPRKDEIGVLSKSFVSMRRKLAETITEVNTASNNIVKAAQELSQGNTDLSRRTESQAASLEETASSMEEMASTIKSSTDHAVAGNNMMVASREAVENAGKIIAETTTNIEEVYEASTKIKNITKIIEDIAFQTNILALNAAVEAARAGDQGKGFAVVASEVRNLAQTTQSSVKDITVLVDNTNEKINKATETARQSQDIFIDIQQKIEDTARIMQDISATAMEQQTGVDQVNRAVAEMDTVTQHNASLVQESANTSESLLAQAHVLKDTVSFFLP